MAKMYDSRDDLGSIVGRLKDGGVPEYQWLFLFAGWLKGRGYLDSEEPPPEAEPLLRSFAMRMTAGRYWESKHLQWNDDEAVGLAFAKAWKQRKHVFAVDHLGPALMEAEEDPLQLEGELNPWVARLVNLAYRLQENHPGELILIPVNEETARRLHTTIRTLSLALEQAIELGYVEVVEPAVTTGKRRARRLRFNYEKLE